MFCFLAWPQAHLHTALCPTCTLVAPRGPQAIPPSAASHLLWPLSSTPNVSREGMVRLHPQPARTPGARGWGGLAALSAGWGPLAAESAWGLRGLGFSLGPRQELDEGKGTGVQQGTSNPTS